MPRLEAFRREYRGGEAPADALWWVTHPGEAAPSGRMDPALQVRALRDALYGPNATAADRAAFARADHALQVERAEVARALARADAASPETPPDRRATVLPGTAPARGSDSTGGASGSLPSRWW